MKNADRFAVVLGLVSLIAMSCDKDDESYNSPGQPVVDATVITGSGDSLAVAAKMVDFRVLIGDPLNSTPGQSSGRREVNWDGVPPQFTNNNSFPLDFFNNTDAAGPNGRKRGLQYPAGGSLIRLDSSDFSEIDATYADQFEPFSRKRMLVAAGTNVLEVVFKVPGTTTDAAVKGFGIVFSDIDDANSTFVEFFNGNKSLGVFKAAPAAGNAKFSFLGVKFLSERITRLRITAGNAALAPGVRDITSGGNKDLVAIDDFLYSEPLPL